MVAIGVEILLRVINGHSTVDTIWQGAVLHNRNALIRSVLMFEEHNSGPVIRKVLGESAGGASASLADIAYKYVNYGSMCVFG